MDVIGIYRNASSWWDEQPSVTLKNLPQTEFFFFFFLSRAFTTQVTVPLHFHFVSKMFSSSQLTCLIKRDTSAPLLLNQSH